MYLFNMYNMRFKYTVLIFSIGNKQHNVYSCSNNTTYNLLCDIQHKLYIVLLLVTYLYTIVFYDDTQHKLLQYIYCKLNLYNTDHRIKI